MSANPRLIRVRAWAEFKKEMLYGDSCGGGLTHGDLLNTFGSEGVMLYSGYDDKNDTEIYEGDICELINADRVKIRVVCKLGMTRRENVYGQLIDISGFYFEDIESGRQSFPMVNNYCGLNDMKLFTVIGNICANPELLVP